MIKKTHKLYKTTSTHAELLIEQLQQAHSFFERAVGLLGHKNLAGHEALWIEPCRDIHTCFMRFSIDCIFLDRQMRVIKIAKNVKPFRFVGPYWKSNSVIEAHSGFADLKKIEVGDHLYVVS